MNGYFNKITGDAAHGRIAGFEPTDMSSWPAHGRQTLPALMMQSERILQCTTNPGGKRSSVWLPPFLMFFVWAADVMYVPSGWWHATINLDESVALPNQEAAEDQWQKPADRYWFRINRLHDQQRHQEKVELLREALPFVDDREADRESYDKFRISLQ